MADMMTFPETWEEFEKSYGFVDGEKIYTNGSRLIQSFRIKQWLDHIAHLESKQQATVSSDCISRQDAKDVVDMELDAIDHVPEWVYDRLLTALDKVPSAQPKVNGVGDLISRQAAIDAIANCTNCGTPDELRKYVDKHSLENGWTGGVLDAMEAVEDIPAADVVPVVHGKWIPHSEKSREYIGTVLVHVMYDYWFCDTCGYRVENGQPTYNFCPNCGAKMDGGKS